MKRVLLITPTYYPLHTPCTFRIHSFAKHLPRHGYETHLATFRWTEENLHYDRFLIGKYFPDVPHESVCPVTEVDWRLPTPWQHCRDKTCEVLLPDFLGRRTRALYDACLELHRRTPFDAVVATTPSVFTFEVARLLYKCYGIPWVADVRDVKKQDHTGAIEWHKLWNYLHRFIPSPKSIQVNRLLASAAACTTVSPGLAEVVRARTGGRVAPHVVFNGFNPGDYDGAAVENAAEFLVTFAGTICPPKQDPRPLLEAVGELLRENAISPRDFQLRWYLSSRQHAMIQDLARQTQSERVCSVRSYVPKSEIVAVNRASQILLHLSKPNTKGVVTSKLGDCLGAERFMLVVPGDGDIMDRVVTETNTGAVASSVGEIKKVILRQYQYWRRHGHADYQPRLEEVAKYTRHRQVAVLAKLLDEITSQGVRRIDGPDGNRRRRTASGHQVATG